MSMQINLPIPIYERTAKFSSIYKALSENTRMSADEIDRVLKSIEPLEGVTVHSAPIVKIGAAESLRELQVRYPLRKNDAVLRDHLIKDMLRNIEAAIISENLFTAWVEDGELRAEVKVVRPDVCSWIDKRTVTMPDTERTGDEDGTAQ